MSPTARRRALQALKGQRAALPAGPLFAVAEEGAAYEADTLDKVAVLFPLPLPEPFDYRAPSSMGLQPGAHVIAPIGSRLVRGVVWAVEHNNPGAANLKAIDEVLPGPLVPELSRQFLDWAARYLVRPPGDLLRMVVRSPEALLDPPTYSVVRPSGKPLPKMTEARTRVMREAEKEAVSAAELSRRAEVSSAVVKGLIDCGALERVEMSEDPPFEEPILDFPFALVERVASVSEPDEGRGHERDDAGSADNVAAERPSPPTPSPQGRGGKRLSGIQQTAADQICAAVRSGGFHVSLLDGVTGSGKTEVYLEAAAEALKTPGAQVLVLIPEIALTQAAMARFKARFGVEPVEWHSAIGHKARRRAWREVAAGRARLVVGARSALFLPFANLRLIVIDEEHDPSYKQEEGVIYQARDLAVARAKMGACNIILASATPSLETLVNAQAGRYAHVKLPVRHAEAELPDVELIDLKLDPPPDKSRWLSPKLVTACAEALSRGEQSLFYMNRRGYAPLTLCRVCGHRMKSPETESWLVEHRYTGRLVCHLTGFSMAKPKACPECLTPDSFTSIGPGVERVHEEVSTLFPDARIEIFSSDTTPNGEAVRDLVTRMETGEIDILIGTQIVAKGHNFPNLTFVGVVDADSGLKGGDLRAGERTFQLISQVAGRAGRHEKRGRALIQTYAPHEPVMQALAAQDRDAFMTAEAQEREAAGMPPYGRLAAVIVSAANDQLANDAAKALGEKAPHVDGLDLWGPAPAPLAVIRGMHRRRFLIRADRGVDLSAFLAAWVARVKLHSAVRVQIDVDPYSFL
jgi:primosomal protein N' (replication factor Y)